MKGPTHMLLRERCNRWIEGKLIIQCLIHQNTDHDLIMLSEQEGKMSTMIGKCYLAHHGIRKPFRKTGEVPVELCYFVSTANLPLTTT